MFDRTLSRYSDRSLVQRETYFFSLYRILQATLLAGLLFTPFGSELVSIDHPLLARSVAMCYLIAAIVLLLWGGLGDHTRRLPVFLGIGIDIVATTLTLHATSRLDGGIATLILVNIASAATLLPFRSAFAFALAAGLAGFFERAVSIAFGDRSERSPGEVMLFGLAYVAAAALSQLLRSEVTQRQKLMDRQESDLASLSQLNELIIRRMRSGVIVVDDRNQIQRINESAWHLLGQPSPTRKDLNGISPSLALRVNEWRAGHATNLQPIALAEGQPEVIPRFVAVPQSDAHHCIVFLEDTSLMTRQAEQLTLSSLGRLSASIAHEVRNPLAAISHAAQLLAESEDFPRSDRRLLEIIRGQCLRMNAIVENILQLSRRQHSKQELVTLSRWAEAFVEEFRTVQPIGQDELKLNVQASGVSVMFDPDQLQQVAWNLVKNALRYGRMPNEPARVALVIRRLPETNQAVLEVVDRGPGIPAKQAAHIFEPFFTTSEMGTGLGLYIARQLCETNQATLDYHSLAGGGSCFRISFHGQPGTAIA
ncbi:MAG: two-component sensor histidine kinase [Xanthomonadales bacterium]|nr:two-component sensor histidine kinase [Xanthomonadales bacterium]